MMSIKHDVRRWLGLSDPALHAQAFALKYINSRERPRNENHIRALCQSVVLTGNICVSRVLGRWKMFLDTRDLTVSVHLMFDGYWEMWLTEEIARVVEPGMVVADIGANVGYFTLLMADLLNGRGQVLSFEPNPYAAELLRRSVVANGFAGLIEIVSDPLGARTGESVRLHIDHEQSGGAFVSDPSAVPDGKALVLTSRRFDDHPLSADVAIAKIDTEGSEQQIWTGMSGALDSGALRVIFLEWCSSRYDDPAGFMAALSAKGFGISILHPGLGIIPATIEGILAEPPGRELTLALRR